MDREKVERFHSCFSYTKFRSTKPGRPAKHCHRMPTGYQSKSEQAGTAQTTILSSRKGRYDNSPAVHCWETEAISPEVPQGRLKNRCRSDISVVPTGLEGQILLVPAINRSRYYRMSLWDKPNIKCSVVAWSDLEDRDQ